MDYAFQVWGIDNLQPVDGGDEIDRGETDGDRHDDDSFVVGADEARTAQVTDGDAMFEDGTGQDQFLTEDLFVGGRHFPAGTQIQNEFVLTTDQPGVEIVVLRFTPPGGELITAGYALTGAVAPGTELRITGVRDGDAGAVPGASLICFAAGTRLSTPAGPRAVEGLRPGALVDTADEGAQPLRWVGRRTVAGRGRFAPVLIRRGAFGAARDVLVSPQHRVLVTGAAAELHFGAAQVLVPAVDLVDGRCVLRRPVAAVTYVHVLFDRHQIVSSDGLASESLQPGAAGLAGMTPQAREEIRALFPDLAEDWARYPAARPDIRGRQARLLAA